MSIVIANQSDSPFDSIRRFDENGKEFWLARELMKLMGYVKWQNFETPIREAIENLELNGDNVLEHSLLTAVTYKGQDKCDYKMT